MANLFEINKAIMDAWDACVDPDTGEIDESKYAEMEALQVEFNTKIENLACWAKTVEQKELRQLILQKKLVT